MGHARALLSLSCDLQTQAAEKIIKNKLSVRETERLVQNDLFNHPKIDTPLKVDADVQQLERKLSETLGAKIYFKQTAKGKGQLIIHYNSLEELDGILSHIN
jgi:ParB family chromosome partitioning protein